MTRAVETKRKKKISRFLQHIHTHTHTHTSSFRCTPAVSIIRRQWAHNIYLYVLYITICVHIYYVLFPAETACRTGKFDVLTPLRLLPCLCIGVRLPVCACDECCSNGVLLIRRGLRTRKYLHTQTHIQHIHKTYITTKVKSRKKDPTTTMTTTTTTTHVLLIIIFGH